MSEYNGGERRDPQNRLTDTQVRRLVDLIDSGKLDHLLEIEAKDAKMKWLMASLRNMAVWVVAILTAISLGWDFIVGVIKGALK